MCQPRKTPATGRARGRADHLGDCPATIDGEGVKRPHLIKIEIGAECEGSFCNQVERLVALRRVRRDEGSRGAPREETRNLAKATARVQHDRNVLLIVELQFRDVVVSRPRSDQRLVNRAMGVFRVPELFKCDQMHGAWNDAVAERAQAVHRARQKLEGLQCGWALKSRPWRGQIARSADGG